MRALMTSSLFCRLIAAVEGTAAFLDHHVNIIIASTAGESSIQGRTYLNGELSPPYSRSSVPLGVYVE